MKKTHSAVTSRMNSQRVSIPAGRALLLAFLMFVVVLAQSTADDSLFPEPRRAEDGTVLVPSRGEWVDADHISMGICDAALKSNVRNEDDVYDIENTIFHHAQTSDSDPNRNQRVQDWWIQAMPHIDCYDRVYDGFEGGSPLNLVAYKGYGAQIIYLMRKYELPPQYMVYPDPRTGLNLFEWMEERSTDADLYDERNPTVVRMVVKTRIADELRLLTRWFTRIGYFE